jgi:hypothetical protein
MAKEMLEDVTLDDIPKDDTTPKPDDAPKNDDTPKDDAPKNDAPKDDAPKGDDAPKDDTNAEDDKFTLTDVEVNDKGQFVWKVDPSNPKTTVYVGDRQIKNRTPFTGFSQRQTREKRGSQ